MAKVPVWLPINDEALVERMIPAVQQAIVDTTLGASQDSDGIEPVQLNAADVANVLLMVLATILETSSGCATPQGIRLTGEAAGKELAELIRDTRQLKQAEHGETGLA